jgi:hypothetical protein
VYSFGNAMAFRVINKAALVIELRKGTGGEEINSGTNELSFVSVLLLC